MARKFSIGATVNSPFARNMTVGQIVSDDFGEIVVRCFWREVMGYELRSIDLPETMLTLAPDPEPLQEPPC